MTNEQRVVIIRERLSSELNPATINVIDQSSHHVGHAGAQTGAGHFAVQITAAAFAGKSRIQCHQMIYALLADLMHKEIHALSIDAKEPREL